ncbi:MAG TPA: ABC transporter ATP-binding protein, partial [Burkholderiaceae bacterium]|nr:ABC transporter ATP-binding protein [Burkholderiaceae bacterium]
MTPDLMESGAQRFAKSQGIVLAEQTESGGRAAGYGRPMVEGEVDLAHGRILYLEDVSVSFDGFKAINKLSLDIAPGELRCIIGP